MFQCTVTSINNTRSTGTVLTFTDIFSFHFKFFEFITFIVKNRHEGKYLIP